VKLGTKNGGSRPEEGEALKIKGLIPVWKTIRKRRLGFCEIKMHMEEEKRGPNLVAMEELVSTEWWCKIL